jgi:hypothetical protein
MGKANGVNWAGDYGETCMQETYIGNCAVVRLFQSAVAGLFRCIFYMIPAPSKTLGAFISAALISATILEDSEHVRAQV